MNKPRILLTYIESGMGHIVSMRAIGESLKSSYAQECTIIESDIMKDGNNHILINFEKFLVKCVQLTNRSKAFGVGTFTFFEWVGKIHFMRLVHKTIFKKATDATIEALKSYDPTVVVSNHYFLTWAAIELKKRFMPNLIVITCNSENNVHVWWENRSDIFINNTEMACDEAIKKRGMLYKNVKLVPLSMRNEVVSANGSKEDYRKKHSLPDQFTVTLADGAYASAKAAVMCTELLKLTFPVTIIFIAGKNEALFAHFSEKIAKTAPNINLVVLPFIPFAYEIYGASDVFITKAGPNAVLDSLCMGTPVIIDYFGHPIELGTVQYFVRTLHCGIEVYNKHKICQHVTDFYEHPELLQTLRANIKKHINKQSNGSKKIAEIIMSATREKNE